jgi:hypothetical protein
MSKISLPNVEVEKDLSKTSKLILVNVIIIIGVMLIAYYYNTNNYITFIPPTIHNIQSTDYKSPNKIISGNIVRLISQNETPITKIVIIDDNRKVIPIFTDIKMIKKLPDCRISIDYHLKNTININEIIIDIDMLNNNSKNIIYTNVEIINNGKISWIYNNDLSYKRYNYIHIYKQPKDNILNHDLFYNINSTKEKDENRLRQYAINNLYI